ncbi:UDP-glucose 4-epimerase GalE [Azospirillum sp. RWY-5-1]|uniref:UDP-glucose 4-epimerase n=1 Tax=Azospirillum oleiclasticum TaxID=2735135 RepID=A0ABX2TM77_9PROT|nr:UDP-glucose 4-epimerase GalE [Azospirillum oleiclasticum]NYZ17534.1 UDP-glucose 4-epimerase GalE [Azospirillum oleiclasticum]NYZ24636.1 UDP-glucose 4-epimerase GalE [Azospirillum oleiclasticum]
MVERGHVLVTGGAGYIGSHAVLALRDAGIPAVVLDDLSTGRRAAVPADVPFVEGDAGDPALLAEVLERHPIGTVMHFAGSIVVPESVEKPLAYYANNTLASHALVEACLRAGVGRFVFSSTAAVYGIPGTLPVDEEAPTRPINPYGRSKLMTEWMLRDAAAAHGLKVVALRYFNVAGADPAGRAGQCSRAATHLIKVACEAAVGRRPGLLVFGDDYPTRDGTCVRDYVHVSDLADAHVAALRHLEGGGEGGVFNVGYGHGSTVREVVAAVERAAGAPLSVRIDGRRAGDPPELVAGIARITRTFGWRPRFDDLDTIVATALAWERRLLETVG